MLPLICLVQVPLRRSRRQAVDDALQNQPICFPPQIVMRSNVYKRTHNDWKRRPIAIGGHDLRRFTLMVYVRQLIIKLRQNFRAVMRHGASIRNPFDPGLFSASSSLKAFTGRPMP